MADDDAQAKLAEGGGVVVVVVGADRNAPKDSREAHWPLLRQRFDPTGPNNTLILTGKVGSQIAHTVILWKMLHML